MRSKDEKELEHLLKQLHLIPGWNLISHNFTCITSLHITCSLKDKTAMPDMKELEHTQGWDHISQNTNHIKDNLQLHLIPHITCSLKDEEELEHLLKQLHLIPHINSLPDIKELEHNQGYIWPAKMISRSDSVSTNINININKYDQPRWYRHQYLIHKAGKLPSCE